MVALFDRKRYPLVRVKKRPTMFLKFKLQFTLTISIDISPDQIYGYYMNSDVSIVFALNLALRSYYY